MAKQTASQAEKVKDSAAEGLLEFVDQDDDLKGFEDINSQTMAVPFIRILQTLSPQLDEESPAYIEDAKKGYWFNTVTKEVYGDSLSVIVLKFERVFIEWLPNRGGLVGYHTPEHAESIATDKTFGKWLSPEGNSLQDTYVYLALVAGHEREGVAVFSLASSAIKVAREWNRLMTTHVMPNGEDAMPYWLVWNLETQLKKNDQGSWFNPDVAFAGYIKEDQYALIKPERLALPDKRVDYAQLESKPQGEDDTKF